MTRLFEKYGEVEKCNIMRDPHSGDSRGFGFVKMVSADAADAAREGLQGQIYEGRSLSIEKARRGRPRTPTPGKYYGPPKRGKLSREKIIISPVALLTLLQRLVSAVVAMATVTMNAVEEATAVAMTLVGIAEAHAIGTVTTTATTTVAVAMERVIVIVRIMAAVSTAMHPAHRPVKIVMVAEAMNVAVTTAVERNAATMRRLHASLPENPLQVAAATTIVVSITLAAAAGFNLLTSHRLEAGLVILFLPGSSQLVIRASLVASIELPLASRSS